MDLTPMHKRVIALDVHQAKITACAVVEHDDGRVEVTKRDFGAFKRERRALEALGNQYQTSIHLMKALGGGWHAPTPAKENVHPQSSLKP